jgi:hypothetical protein
MQRRAILSALVVLLALDAPEEAQGQWGAVLDWINGLSGPRVGRIGPEWALAPIDERNRVNLSALYGFHVGDRGNPDSEAADISTFSFQSTLESTLIGEGGAAELMSRIGFEVHRFSGEFDSFWAPSFPVLVALRMPIDRWAIELGTGFNIFKFPEDAFSPFDVGVAREGFDAGWTLRAVVEYGSYSLFR